MNEDEIIKIIQDDIDYRLSDLCEYDKRKEAQAEQGLLDLYPKEKEKNEEINKLKGFEILDIFNMGKESSRQRIKYDWVEKEKIREKLKEEQERLKAGFGKMYKESLGNSATRILKELLEENNEM